jgi:hypothetical protein
MFGRNWFTQAIKHCFKADSVFTVELIFVSSGNHTGTYQIFYFVPLLPAGRKFCKITQNRPSKLATIWPPCLGKSGRKAAEQNFCVKNWFLRVFLLLSVSLSQQIFKNIYTVNI